jgi:hypothetical protein
MNESRPGGAAAVRGKSRLVPGAALEMLLAAVVADTDIPRPFSRCHRNPFMIEA